MGFLIIAQPPADVTNELVTGEQLQHVSGAELQFYLFE